MARAFCPLINWWRYGTSWPECRSQQAYFPKSAGQQLHNFAVKAERARNDLEILTFLSSLERFWPLCETQSEGKGILIVVKNTRRIFCDEWCWFGSTFRIVCNISYNPVRGCSENIFLLQQFWVSTSFFLFLPFFFLTADQLERVFLRLGHAETDEQLQNIISKFLPPVLLKLSSTQEGVRKKVRL